jgi:hypothetical protein
MNEPSVLIRCMDVFHPVDAPDGSNTYSHFADAARGFTEELGCEDGHRSHFEVRYGAFQLVPRRSVRVAARLAHGDTSLSRSLR